MVAEENRYDRQERIHGWQQNALKDAKISIVGAGPMANFFSAVGAGLGFGSMWVFDNKVIDPRYTENFLFPLSEDKSELRNKRLEEMIGRINPAIESRGITWKFCTDYFTEIIGKPNAIVLTTNNPKTELLISEYGLYSGIPIINGSANTHNAELTVLRDRGEIKERLEEVKKDKNHTLADMRRCIPEQYLSDVRYHK